MSVVRRKVPFSLLELSQVCFIVFLLSPIMSGYDWMASGMADSNMIIPFFDDDISKREFDATVGQTLVLPCTVRNVRDKVVSWIRSRDLHILTSGPYTFSSDFRFEPVHSDSSGDFWGLRIRGVKINDTGQYECQVNTEPKMSMAVKLTVRVSGESDLDIFDTKWVSRALIKGPSEVYVQYGSPVSFTCEISPLSLASSRTTSTAHGIFFTGKPRVWWLHDGKEVAFEAQRDNITSDTTYRDKDQSILSTISIPTASWSDGGQYTCMQPSTKPANVKLIVVEAETSEAMQRDYPIPSRSSVCNNHLGFCLVLSIITKLYLRLL